MNKTLEELKELLDTYFDLNPFGSYDMKDLTVQSYKGGVVEATYNLFGERWTWICYHPATGLEIKTYDHLLGEQIIIAKVIPILKEIIEMNKVSIEDTRVARIATLKAERDKINKELKSLSLPIDGKEVEGEL